MTIVWIIGTTLLSGLLGMTAALLLLYRQRFAERATIILLSFAAGSMLGAVFFDLLPESLEIVGETALPFILLGILIFFLLEKGLLMHHHHEAGEWAAHRLEASKSLVLLGDAFHNFLDGVVIATAFLASTKLGIVAGIAVLAHELPQEIGDFGILLAGKMARRRIIFWNIMSAMVSVLGAVLVILVSGRLEGLIAALLPLATGGFLYIAIADLIPELHREVRLRHSLAHLGSLVAGLLVIYLIGLTFHV